MNEWLLSKLTQRCRECKRKLSTSLSLSFSDLRPPERLGVRAASPWLWAPMQGAGSVVESVDCLGSNSASDSCQLPKERRGGERKGGEGRGGEWRGGEGRERERGRENTGFQTSLMNSALWKTHWAQEQNVALVLYIFRHSSSFLFLTFYFDLSHFLSTNYPWKTSFIESPFCQKDM